MNTQLFSRGPSAERVRNRRRVTRRSSVVVLRRAAAHDAPALHALIQAHTDEGHLLPREFDELKAHAPRFVVAVQGGRLVGCAELAPLSGGVAEVRSLVVAERARGLGIARQLVAELRKAAPVAGYERLCAFAHDAGLFVRLGFSIVPHTWVPEKIARDCVSCAQFGRCGQHALVLDLNDPSRRRANTIVPLAYLRA